MTRRRNSVQFNFNRPFDYVKIIKKKKLRKSETYTVTLQSTRIISLIKYHCLKQTFLRRENLKPHCHRLSDQHLHKLWVAQTLVSCTLFAHVGSLSQWLSISNFIHCLLKTPKKELLNRCSGFLRNRDVISRSFLFLCLFFFFETSERQKKRNETDLWRL